MQALTNVLMGLVTGQPGKAGRALEATWREIVLYALAALLLLGACAAGLVGLGLYLAPEFGPVGAALIVAAITALLALGLIVLALLIERKAKRTRKRDEQAMVTSALMTLAPHVLQAKSPLSLILAGGLGYLAAETLSGKSDKSRDAGRRPRELGYQPHK